MVNFSWLYLFLNHYNKISIDLDIICFTVLLSITPKQVLFVCIILCLLDDPVPPGWYKWDHTANSYCIATLYFILWHTQEVCNYCQQQMDLSVSGWKVILWFWFHIGVLLIPDKLKVIIFLVKWILLQELWLIDMEIQFHVAFIVIGNCAWIGCKLIEKFCGVYCCVVLFCCLKWL